MERRAICQTGHHRQILACLQACQRNSSLRAGSVGPPFGLHSQQTQQDLCRERQHAAQVPSREVWEQCASFEPKPFTSSSARSWFQKVLCGAAHQPPSPSLTEGRPGLASPQLLWTPDPAQCRSSQSKAGCSQPSPSHSRRVCDRITARLQLSFDPGSDQNSAFSRSQAQRGVLSASG